MRTSGTFLPAPHPIFLYSKKICEVAPPLALPVGGCEWATPRTAPLALPAEGAARPQTPCK
jgi:hypothetical protein